MQNRISYIKYSDTNLVVLVNGKHRSFTDPERVQEIYEASVIAKKEPTDANIDSLLDAMEPIRRYQLEDNVEIDSNGYAYLGDTNVPMPEELGDLLIDFVAENRDISPLINFWNLCLLNPNEHARDKFFTYVRDYGIVITDNGYVILYKALNKQSRGKLSDFSDFIGEQYLKIKRQKKSPRNYDVYSIYDKHEWQQYEDGDIEEIQPVRFDISTHSGNEPVVDEIEVVEVLGNLQTLYNNITKLDDDQQTIYKPWFSGGNYGNEVKLGETVSMPREECDPNINTSCSKGLHVGSFTYVSSFGRGMNSVLAILVNPKNIVALPESDHSKIRVCEYYPYAVMERDDNGNWEEIEDNHFEEEYIEEEIESIKERLKEMYSDRTKVNKEEETILNSRLIELEN